MLAYGTRVDGFSTRCTLSTLKSRIPFLHFFDGYRVSAQINKINSIPYENLQELVPHDAIQQNVREVALNPNHPIIRGTGQRPDIWIQMQLLLINIMKLVQG